MYTIKTLNAISPVGLAKLPPHLFEVDSDAAEPQGILVRSADLHDMPLPDSLLAIARAGAGTNNIPIDKCTAAASWCSTPPAPTPTRWPSWWWARWWRAAATCPTPSTGPRA